MDTKNARLDESKGIAMTSGGDGQASGTKSEVSSFAADDSGGLIKYDGDDDDARAAAGEKGSTEAKPEVPSFSTDDSSGMIKYEEDDA